MRYFIFQRNSHVKSILLLLLSSFICQLARSQWTTADASNNINNTNSGNVGIGVTAPANKLDVETTAQIDGLKVGYNGDGFIRLHPNSLFYGAYNPLVQAGDAGIIYGSTTHNINFGLIIAPWSGNQGGIRLDPAGNVGINTANTYNYTLAVNGSAIFTKAVVKLYSNWPDYVFHPAYKLASLDSVSEYIQANHHLPEMPSADSVQKNGLDLGSNQAALLKKIEELTLYLIQQNKELGELKEGDKKTAAVNKKLEEQVSMLIGQNKLLMDQNCALKAQQERIDRLEKLMSEKK